METDRPSRQIRADPPPAGVLIVDKKGGRTSHDVVMAARKALGVREIGHAGTLDPMATGVLVLAVGEGTKLVPWLTAHDKVYQATVALGVQTDTLDADGKVALSAPPNEAILSSLERSADGHLDGPLAVAFERARTQTLQMPPAYSAIRTGGERAFALARRGEQPTLAPRSIQVERITCLSCTATPPTLNVELVVGKGYYVRSFARDIATELGTVGHLTALRRLRSGPFKVEEAVMLDGPHPNLRAHLVPLPVAAARALPVGHMTESGAQDARSGRRVQPNDVTFLSPGPCAWLDSTGALVAVGQFEEDGRGRVLRGFGPRSS